MSRKYKMFRLGLASIFAAATMLVFAAPALADTTVGQPIGPGVGGINVTSLPGASSDNATTSMLQKVLQIVFGIAGALALLVITIAGFRYVTSAGDPQAMSGAKNAIIYALVGLLVAMFAEAIVSFVAGKL